MSLDFSKLECVKALADRTIAACPACREQGHDKKGNHLVIWPDGKFGCVSNPEDGAHRSRIFALAGEKDKKPSPARTPARRRSSWPTIEAAAAAITPPGFHLEAVYRYGNAAAVARYEPDEDGEKTFRQFSIDGSAWVAGAPTGKWPLFGPIPTAKDAPIILVTEGEKACLAARSIGLPCVCSSGGASAATKSDWSPLAGRKVAILPDNDAPGRKYADVVATLLAALDPPATAKRIILPDLPERGDIEDYIASRPDASAAQIASDIMKMVSETFDRRKQSSPKNGQKGGRPPITKEIADSFVESLGTPFPLRRHRGDWFYYDGIAYRPYTSDDLNAAIMGHLRSRFPGNATKTMVANIAANLMGDDLAGIPSRFQMPCWFPSGDSADGWITMSNAIVNVNALARRANGEQIEPQDIKRDHTADFFSTFMLEYPFDPDAQCPIWLDYLQGVQPDPATRDMLQMLMGLCLVPDTSYEVFFVFYGNGGCGKSVFLHTLEHVVGKANICALPLSKFGEKHSAHMLTESLVNIVGDLPTSDGKMSLHSIEGILKDAVSGGLISCEKKNQQPYQAHAISRCIFATNSLPTFADRTDGIWDRIRIVPFDIKFRDTDRQNPNLKREIQQQELPGVFNWAVQGLAKLRNLRQFPRGPRGEEERARHRDGCDHEAQFLRDTYQQRNGSFVVGQQIYSEYRQFCYDNGYRPKNAANFASDLRRVFNFVVEDRRRVNGALKRGFLNIEPVGALVFGDEEI